MKVQVVLMTRNNLQILVEFTPLGEDPQNKMHRSHLWFCFINVDRLTCCRRNYLAQSNAGTPPPQNTNI